MPLDPVPVAPLEKLDPIFVEKKRAQLEQTQSSDEDSDGPPKPKRLRKDLFAGEWQPNGSHRTHRTTVPSPPWGSAELVDEPEPSTRNGNSRKLEDDAEAELKRLMKSWTAPVYAFFEPTPKIAYHEGRRCHVFQCYGRGCSKTVHRFLDKKDHNSTSNLIRHVRSCKSWGSELWDAAKNAKDVTDARENVVKPYRMAGNINATFQVKGKGKLTYAHRQTAFSESRAEIVRWFMENFRSFDIIEDRGFKSLIRNGRTDHYLPSAATVSRDIKHVFARCRSQIAKILREYEGNLHFVTDTWTAPNRKAYMANTVHFERDGSPNTIVLDVIEVAKMYSGINLAAAFKASLEEFGIAHKIQSITAHNSSDKDAMIAELDIGLPDFSVVNHTRCFLHIVNLVARSFLGQFSATKCGESDEDEDLDALVRQVTQEEARSVVDGEDDEEDPCLNGWIDEVEQMPEEERLQLLERIEPIKRVLFKLRKIAYEILNSPTGLFSEWVRAFEESGREVASLLPDDESRWKTSYEMVDVASTNRDIVDGFTAKNLQSCCLSPSEWEIVEQVCRVLKVLKEANSYFSRSVTGLADAIPAIDEFAETLSSYFVDQTLDPAIRAAISTTRKTLKRYYSPKEMSEPHIVATILHPRRKLQYFEKAGRKKDWIENAERILRDTFERSYCKKEDKTQRQLHNEISRYLRAPLEFPENPLIWWVEHKRSYPNLSRMALDYLTIPSTSTSVKHLFAKSRILLSYSRSRMSVHSARAVMCLNSWSVAGLVTEEDVFSAVSEPEVEQGEEEPRLEIGWDAIRII